MSLVWIIRDRRAVVRMVTLCLPDDNAVAESVPSVVVISVSLLDAINIEDDDDDDDEGALFDCCMQRNREPRRHDRTIRGGMSAVDSLALPATMSMSPFSFAPLFARVSAYFSSSCGM